MPCVSFPAPVCVFGRGGVATALSVLLADAGMDVIAYRPDGLRKLRLALQDGCSVRSTSVECFVPGETHRARRPACVLVALKLWQFDESRDMLRREFGDGIPMLMFQNGPPWWLLGRWARGQEIPVVANLSVSLQTPGFARLHAFDGLLVNMERLRRLGLQHLSSGLVAAGFRHCNDAELRVARWVKLLTATTGARMALGNYTIGHALSDSVLRAEMAELVREGGRVVAIAEGSVSSDRLGLALQQAAEHWAEGRIVGDSSASLKTAWTSLHQDLALRRGVTEVAWLNGTIAQLGRCLGVETPLNAFLWHEVEALARRRRTPQDAAADEALQSRVRAVFGNHAAMPSSQIVLTSASGAIAAAGREMPQPMWRDQSFEAKRGSVGQSAGGVVPASLRAERYPRISVLVPVRDRDAEQCSLTQRVLQSLCGALRGIDGEIVLVDDGSLLSPVGQSWMGELDTKIHTIRFPRPGGLVRALNAAALQASGDLLTYCHSDCIAEERCFQNLIEAFDDDRVGLVTAELWYPSGELQQIGGWIGPGFRLRWEHEWIDKPQDIHWGDLWTVRAGLFSRHGGLPSAYNPGYWECVDLATTVRLGGWLVRSCPGARFTHMKSQTFHRLYGPEERQKLFERNRERFAARWGYRETEVVAGARQGEGWR